MYFQIRQKFVCLFVRHLLAQSLIDRARSGTNRFRILPVVSWTKKIRKKGWKKYLIWIRAYAAKDPLWCRRPKKGLRNLCTIPNGPDELRWAPWMGTMPCHRMLHVPRLMYPDVVTFSVPISGGLAELEGILLKSRQMALVPFLHIAGSCHVQDTHSLFRLQLSQHAGHPEGSTVEAIVTLRSLAYIHR